VFSRRIPPLQNLMIQATTDRCNVFWFLHDARKTIISQDTNHSTKIDTRITKTEEL
jgi:hypothetical protein